MHRRSNADGVAPRAARRPGQARALVALAAWTLFAFAGGTFWTTIPLIVGAVVLALAVRPSIARGSMRWFDLALVACLLLIACQIVPLPAALRLTLSPRAGGVDSALWLDAPSSPFAGPARPLSIDVGATRMALLLAATVLLFFWSARTILARGGIRVVARGIAWTGLALAVVALLQHATAPKLLYWHWPTIFGGPFGPYLNRSDFSMWLILAIPVTVGYLLARIESAHRASGHVDFAAIADGTAIWLAGAISFMSAALLTAMSRSGLTGAAVALACFVWLSRRRTGHSGRALLLAGVTVVLAVAVTYANVGALADRVGETIAGGIGGRRVIWGDTWAMVRDFWLTGIGAGAYQRGMLVYQQHLRGHFYFNHAHNEYLQLAAEGGVLLGIPAAVAVLAGIRQVAHRLRRDDGAIFWIRVGAASGMLAAAVQSVWETGLRMPANAALFALLAAIALHDAGDRHKTQESPAPES
jgi:O-antigen ligase